MSCGRTGRLANMTMKKESTWGTYIAGDLLFRFVTESLNRAIEHGEDASIIGSLYTTEKIKVADGAAGSIEGSMHGDTIGTLVNGVLGANATSDPSNAVVIISYSGSDPYIRLTKTASNLLAEKSADGSSWAPDTAFNTTGTIDLSSAAFDTVTELVTAINTYAGYHAESFGSLAGITDNIADFAATNIFEDSKNNGAAMLHTAVSASTTAKRHTITAAGAGVCLPSYSFTVNRVLGTNKSMGFTGSKFGSINLTNTAKDLCKFSLSVDCKAEEVDQTDINLSIPEVQAMTTPNMKIIAVEQDGNMVTMDEVKDFGLTINSNVDENRVIGSLTKLEQLRQNSTIDISLSANNTATQYGVRDSYINDTPVEFLLYFKSNTLADTGIPYQMVIRLGAVKLTDYNSPISTGDRLVISGAGTAERPKSSVNTEHITVDVIDNILTTY